MSAEVIIPEEALRLGGFVLAHGAWSISDADPEERLVPMLVIENNGERRLRLFEDEDPQRALETAEACLSDLPAEVETWAFARPAWISAEDGSEYEALLVDLSDRKSSTPLTLVQPYEFRAENGGFRLSAPMEILFRDAAVDEESSEPLVASIDAGINEHRAAAALWNHWLEPV